MATYVLCEWMSDDDYDGEFRCVTIRASTSTINYRIWAYIIFYLVFSSSFSCIWSTLLLLIIWHVFLFFSFLMRCIAASSQLFIVLYEIYRRKKNSMQWSHMSVYFSDNIHNYNIYLFEIFFHFHLQYFPLLFFFHTHISFYRKGN